jgi:hypothetical protein
VPAVFVVPLDRDDNPGMTKLKPSIEGIVTSASAGAESAAMLPTPLAGLSALPVRKRPLDQVAAPEIRVIKTGMSPFFV